jgi:chemotaxis protein MotA
MDKATLIGLVLGFTAIIGGQVLEGGKVGSIIQFTAFVIVFGGTFGAVFMSYPFHDVVGAFKGIKNVIMDPPQEPYRIIDQITEYANKARREGILSLEKEIKNVRILSWPKPLPWPWTESSPM